MKQKYFKELLLFLPFFLFFLGYFFISFSMQDDVVTVPLLVGKPSLEAVELLSYRGLNMRILRKQEDADLPVGTILEQVPRSGGSIRPNRHVFVTISEKPPILSAPCLIGTRYEPKVFGRSKTKTKESFFKVPSVSPQNICVAQFPSPGKPVGQKGLTVYVSEGRRAFAIMPNCIGQQEDEVAEIFHDDTIFVHYVVQGKGKKRKASCKVVDQKPAAGSIVDLGRPLHVQLQIKPE
jgi:beta-lactam-binding protein with PASTA domain